MPTLVPPPRLRAAALAAALLAFSAAPARAQAPAAAQRPDGARVGPCDADEVAAHQNEPDRGFACEQRTLVLSPRAAVRVNAGNNGGVRVRGADTLRAPVAVAVVTAQARTDDDAQRLVAAVRVRDDGVTLSAYGPDGDALGGRAWWTVSWRVTVPRRSDLDVQTNNGGVRVAGVAGRMRLHTNNGGLRVDSVGGSVVARTNNGGATATLAGRAWDPAGQPDAGRDLHSNNGGAMLRVPADYSARVLVGSNSGPIATDFPVTVQGRVDPRRLELTLGAGDAPLRATTNNGGVRLARVR